MLRFAPALAMPSANSMLYGIGGVAGTKATVYNGSSSD